MANVSPTFAKSLLLLLHAVISTGMWDDLICEILLTIPTKETKMIGPIRAIGNTLVAMRVSDHQNVTCAEDCLATRARTLLSHAPKPEPTTVTLDAAVVVTNKAASPNL